MLKIGVCGSPFVLILTLLNLPLKSFKLLSAQGTGLRSEVHEICHYYLTTMILQEYNKELKNPLLLLLV